MVIVSTNDSNRCKSNSNYHFYLVIACDEDTDARNCAEYWGSFIQLIEVSQKCKISELPSLENFDRLQVSSVNIRGLGLKKLDERFFTKFKGIVEFLLANDNELKDLPEGIF